MAGILLPVVNLIGASVGSKFTLDWRNASVGVYLAPTARQRAEGAKAHLLVWNESGAGLTVILPDKPPTTFIPAGGWRTINLDDDTQSLMLTVAYILPNAPVSQLFAVYYAPGDSLDDIGYLGNSPIGGGVPLSVSQVINDNNPTPTIVLETTPLGGTFSAAKITNDGKLIAGQTTIIDEATGATGLIIASGASGADGVIASRQSGAATGVALQSWDGALARVPFSIGGQFGSAATWLDALGNLGALAGIAASGKRGAAISVARGDDVHVTNTSATTIATFTVPNESPNPLVRCSAVFLVPTTNTNPGTITLQVSYTDPFDSAAHVQTFVQTSGGNTVGLLATTVIRQAFQYGTIPMVIECKPNTTVSIVYTNGAAGTIGDFVTGRIQLL